jgi:hypothetical protein
MSGWSDVSDKFSHFPVVASTIVVSVFLDSQRRQRCHVKDGAGSRQLQIPKIFVSNKKKLNEMKKKHTYIVLIATW